MTRLWWTYDDANLLHTVIDNTPADYFHRGDVWPQKLFTPLMMVWFEAMLAFLGLAPSKWYVPHLVFFAASALALFFALRLYLEPLASCVGALLFVASVPVCSLITELSGIHYFQAVLFGALAVITYVKALRTNRLAWTVVSAAIYLLAMLAKEIAIPLVAVLVLLPDRELRARIRFAIPHAVAVLLYFAWRYAVLGVLLGGYGWAVAPEERPALVMSLPKKVVLALAGVNVTLGVVFLCMTAIGVVLAMRNRRAIALTVVAVTVAILPALPVSKEMQRRYAFAAGVVWFAAFVVGAETLRRRKPALGTALLIVAPILGIAVNRQEWAHEFGRTQRMADEARFFYDMRDGLLRQPGVPPAAMGELQWLKTQYAHRPASASWFYDDIVLCESGVGGKRVWGYAPQQRMVVELTNELPSIARRSCGAIRANAPMRLDFHYHDNALFWTFGPYVDGKWRVLLGNGAYDVPRVEGYGLPGLPGITLRVRYESPAGWVTYSPDIALDFVRRPRETWQR